LKKNNKHPEATDNEFWDSLKRDDPTKGGTNKDRAVAVD
jgi:hypothetical protein